MDLRFPSGRGDSQAPWDEETLPLPWRMSSQTLRVWHREELLLRIRAQQKLILARRVSPTGGSSEVGEDLVPHREAGFGLLSPVCRSLFTGVAGVLSSMCVIRSCFSTVPGQCHVFFSCACKIDFTGANSSSSYHFYKHGWGEAVPMLGCWGLFISIHWDASLMNFLCHSHSLDLFYGFFGGGVGVVITHLLKNLVTVVCETG